MSAAVDTTNLPHEKSDVAEAVGQINVGSQLPTAIPKDELKQEWLDSFSDARSNVALCTPLLSYLMYQATYVWTMDVKTARALPHDGKNYIFINPLFWMNKLRSKEERAFVLLHEIKHIFLEHCGRQVDHGYNHELWNIAADYNINISCSGVYREKDGGGVQQCKRYADYIARPKFCLYDERFIGYSSDEIYHMLLEENDGDAKKAVENHGGGGRPDGNAEGQMPLDDVSTESPDHVHKLDNRQNASAAVAQADMNKSIGDSEGHLVNHLRELSEPKVNWKDELASAIMSSTRERPTYNRLSRRVSGDVAFPALTGHKISGVFGFDSSGSMSQKDYADVSGELKGLMEQFEAWELHLISCDTKAHEIGHFSSDEGDDFETMTFSFEGGGGTELSPMVHYANELMDEEEIAFNIILTDGYIPEAPMENAFDDRMVNIVVVTSEGNSNLKLENARVIYMKDVG